MARHGACVVPQLQEAVCWLVAGPDAPPEQQCLHVREGQICSRCKYFVTFHQDLATHMNPEEVAVVARCWVALCGHCDDEQAETGGDDPHPLGFDAY